MYLGRLHYIGAFYLETCSDINVRSEHKPFIDKIWYFILFAVTYMSQRYLRLYANLFDSIILCVYSYWAPTRIHPKR